MNQKPKHFFLFIVFALSTFLNFPLQGQEVFNPFPCTDANTLPSACLDNTYSISFEYTPVSAGTVNSWTGSATLGTLGLSINSSTGVLSGLIPNDAALVGTHTFTVTANIDGTTTAPKTFSIRIDDASTCETLSGPAQPCLREFAFVLDRSGSMGDPSVPTDPASDSKWAVLDDILDTYLTYLASGANLNNSDSIGVVLFYSSQADLLTRSSVNDGFPDLSMHTPQGGTPLGGGIQRSVTDVFTGLGVPGQGKKRILIALTDGIQNRSPEILNRTLVDAGFPNGGIIGGTFPMDFDAGTLDQITVFSLGVGTEIPSTAHSDLNAFSHQYESTLDPASDLDDFFDAIISDALPATTPRLLDIRKGVFNPSNDFQTETFAVNDSVSSFTLKLKNLSGDFGEPQFTILKDGVELAASPILFNENTVIYDFNFPPTVIGGAPLPDTSRGNWTIRFRDWDPFNYKVTALVDEKNIHHSLDFSEDEDFYTGDDIPVRVRIWDKRGPVTGATVVAQIKRPGDEIGDIASNMQVNPDSFLFNEENILAGQAKINYLVRQQAVWNQLQGQLGNQITLNDEGNGYYTGSFSGNDITGSYRVVTKINGTHTTLGAFEGWESHSAFLDFARPSDIELNEVITDLGGGDGTQSYQVVITPTNQFGKKIGPAQQKRISAAVSNGNVFGWQDNLDGSYEFTVSVPEGTSPDLQIFVIDQSQPVFDEKIDGSKNQFGLSLHAGYILSLSNTPPLDSLDSGLYAEIDFSYRINPNFGVQAVGGYYRFDNNFSILGASLFGEYTLPDAISQDIDFRAAAGFGVFKPDNQSASFGLGVKAGATWEINPGLEAMLDLGWYGLTGADYQFGYLGVGVRYFLF